MLLILKNKTIFVYNANGNMIYVNTEEVKINGQIAEKAQEKKFIWDEENRLGAVDINGYVSNYTYDAGGERVTKLSGGGQGIFVNSVFAGGKTSTSDFTLYVNPYLVAQNGGRYTKHIYIGSQRIVSKLGDFDSYGADPRRVEKAGESFSGVKVNYDAKYKKSLEVVKANYDTFEVPYYGNDNNDYVNGLGFCCNPRGESVSGGESSSTTGKMTAKNDNAELQQFYYHPDHLGSSSYISNLDGEVVQHVEYVPFGEVFLEEKNAKLNTPYLFTSKELDRETGLYYFGARYQDPKLGIFISVDPLAENSLGCSSYNYVANNPIKFIDPDGREKIVVVGNQGSSPNSDRKNRDSNAGYKYKENTRHFLQAGLDAARKYKKKAGNEMVTMIIYKGEYTNDELKLYQDAGTKSGINVKVISDDADIKDYINKKKEFAFTTSARDNDLISDFTYVGHGWTKSMLVGGGSIIFSDGITPSDLNTKAFDTNANIFLNSCGSANGSLFSGMKEKTKGNVTGFNSTVIWGEGGLGTYRGNTQEYYYPWQNRESSSRKELPSNQIIINENGTR